MVKLLYGFLLKQVGKEQFLPLLAKGPLVSSVDTVFEW